MASGLKPGLEIELQTPSAFYRGELLPRLSIIFGGGTTVAELPIENIRSEYEAFRIVRERFPKAFFEDWLTCYAGGPSVNETLEEGIVTISMSFYEFDVDLLHDEMLPKGSNLVFTAGQIEWFVMLAT